MYNIIPGYNIQKCKLNKHTDNSKKRLYQQNQNFCLIVCCKYLQDLCTLILNYVYNIISLGNILILD